MEHCLAKIFHGKDPKEEIKKYKIGDTLKVKIISNDNDKISLSVREIEGIHSKNYKVRKRAIL